MTETPNSPNSFLSTRTLKKCFWDLISFLGRHQGGVKEMLCAESTQLSGGNSLVETTSRAPSSFIPKRGLHVRTTSMYRRARAQTKDDVINTRNNDSMETMRFTKRVQAGMLSVCLSVSLIEGLDSVSTGLPSACELSSNKRYLPT